VQKVSLPIENQSVLCLARISIFKEVPVCHEENYWILRHFFALKGAVISEES